MLPAVEERIGGLGSVTSGDYHGGRAECMHGLRDRSPVDILAEGNARQRTGLRQVGRDDDSKRKQAPDQHGDRVLAQQARARRRHHHRIDDQRDRPLREEVRDGLDGRGREQHARLRRVDSDVAEDGLELSEDDVGRHLVDGRHTGRVLRGQGDDRAHAVAAEMRERLQVGLDSGAAARVRAGDREAAGYHESRGYHRPNGCHRSALGRTAHR